MRLTTILKTIAAASAIAAASLFATTGAWAQTTQTDTGTGNASVLIQADILVAETQELSFGTVGTGTTDGTCIVTAGGTLGPCAGGATGGEDGSVGTFLVTGVPLATYTITAPITGSNSDTDTTAGEATLIHEDEGGPSMVVNLFEFDNSGTGVLSNTGTNSFNVGARLLVNANQLPGDYMGTYNVTVTYP